MHAGIPDLEPIAMMEPETMPRAACAVRAEGPELVVLGPKSMNSRRLVLEVLVPPKLAGPEVDRKDAREAP